MSARPSDAPTWPTHRAKARHRHRQKAAALAEWPLAI